MHVTLVRTGGLAGLRRETQVDASQLAPEEAAALREAAKRLLNGKPRRRTAPARPDRDRFHYDLTVEDAGSSRTITFAEGQEPPGLGPLLAILRGRRG